MAKKKKKSSVNKRLFGKLIGGRHDLFDEEQRNIMDKYEKIIRDAGKGSRRGTQAAKDMETDLARSMPRANKDIALIHKYGEDARASRSYGTDRGLSEEQLRSNNFSNKKDTGGTVTFSDEKTPTKKKKKKKKGGRAVSDADAKKGGRATSNKDVKKKHLFWVGGKAASYSDAKRAGIAVTDADAKRAGAVSDAEAKRAGAASEAAAKRVGVAPDISTGSAGANLYPVYKRGGGSVKKYARGGGVRKARF